MKDLEQLYHSFRETGGFSLEAYKKALNGARHFAALQGQRLDIKGLRTHESYYLCLQFEVVRPLNFERIGLFYLGKAGEAIQAEEPVRFLERFEQSRGSSGAENLALALKVAADPTQFPIKALEFFVQIGTCPGECVC